MRGKLPTCVTSAEVCRMGMDGFNSTTITVKTFLVIGALGMKQAKVSAQGRP